MRKHWRTEDGGEKGVLARTGCGAYVWRKRLRKEQPMRFALVETGPSRQPPAKEAGLELVLSRGERLRISVGVDSTLLRTALEAPRA